jgi:F0F1-type ATP synthase assembly protein I
VDEQVPPKRGTLADSVRTIGALSSVGLSFVLAIVIGVLVGLWLDRLFGTSRVFFFIFFILGFVAGILNVYRTAGRFLK